jgi:uncharacterized protein (TIGR02246 family)
MKYCVPIIAVCTFAATISFGQGPQAAAPTPSADIREIERLEAEWNAINEVSDAEGKTRLLADDSYHVGPSGRLYNKAQDVEAMRASRAQKEASKTKLVFIETNRRIRMYEGLAVVTLTAYSITTLPDGTQRRGGSFRAVHVWEKRDEKWLLVVDQVTAIATPPSVPKN